MDNVSTHMTADVEMAIAETGVIWIYGAPYSPHLSPIEIIFHFTKHTSNVTVQECMMV